MYLIGRYACRISWTGNTAGPASTEHLRHGRVTALFGVRPPLSSQQAIRYGPHAVKLRLLRPGRAAAPHARSNIVALALDVSTPSTGRRIAGSARLPPGRRVEQDSLDLLDLGVRG